MPKALVMSFVLFSSHLALAQAAPQPAGSAPPTLEQIRKSMGIPSHGDVRGQMDVVGFASKPEQMAKVWELTAAAPLPEILGPKPAAGVAGILSPHDDYYYAGRVYRQVVPLVTAKRVVMVGVFHKYRRFGTHDRLVFDTYRAWRSPDGDIRISDLREALLARMPAGDVVRDAASHDSEHSLEAIAYWLKHQRPDVEIVPIIVPSASFARLQEMSTRLGQALAGVMKERGWKLGKDVAVVISSDGTHYGADFSYVPYGEGGVEAFSRAMARDREILHGPLSGPVSVAKARDFFTATVNPDNPDEYRMPWCGRFSIPVGLMLLAETARGLGLPPPRAMPVALGATVDTPGLPLDQLDGMGVTAPASLYHFVSAPGVAFVVGK